MKHLAALQSLVNKVKAFFSPVKFDFDIPEEDAISIISAPSYCNPGGMIFPPVDTEEYQ